MDIEVTKEMIYAFCNAISDASITHQEYKEVEIGLKAALCNINIPSCKPAVAVPVQINCPQCDVAHIDEGEWVTRLHKTHQCQNCKHEWRPFDYPTVGIAPSHGQQSAPRQCRIGQPTRHDTEPQVTIEHNGKLFDVDQSISDFVRLLNSVGLETVASCSGHGHRPANIALKDGREIIIARDYEEARNIDRIFPVDINGDISAVYENTQDTPKA